MNKGFQYGRLSAVSLSIASVMAATVVTSPGAVPGLNRSVPPQIRPHPTAAVLSVPQQQITPSPASARFSRQLPAALPLTNSLTDTDSRNSRGYDASEVKNYTSLESQTLTQPSSPGEPSAVVHGQQDIGNLVTESESNPFADTEPVFLSTTQPASNYLNGFGLRLPEPGMFEVYTDREDSNRQRIVKIVIRDSAGNEVYNSSHIMFGSVMGEIPGIREHVTINALVDGTSLTIKSGES